MNKGVLFAVLSLCFALPAWSQRNVREDASAPSALLTLPDASRWKAGVSYGRISRQVDFDGIGLKLHGDEILAELSFSLMPWLELYGQLGGTEAYLIGAFNQNPGIGLAGALGGRLYAWQYHRGVQETAWRVTLYLDVHHAFRTTEDKGEGWVEWGETLVMLPLDYHLTFARSFRNFYMAEFHSLRVYAGPAYSKIDGALKRGVARRDFEEEEMFGLAGGTELWLLENFSVGARAEWFENTTLKIQARYRF